MHTSWPQLSRDKEAQPPHASLAQFAESEGAQKMPVRIAFNFKGSLTFSSLFPPTEEYRFNSQAGESPSQTYFSAPAISLTCK